MALSQQSSVQLIYLIGSGQSGCLSQPNRDPLETDTAIVGQLSVTVIPFVASSELLIGVKHGVFALGLGAARHSCSVHFCCQVEIESCIARCWKPWERRELIWLVTCFSTLAAVSFTFFLEAIITRLAALGPHAPPWNSHKHVLYLQLGLVWLKVEQLLQTHTKRGVMLHNTIIRVVKWSFFSNVVTKMSIRGKKYF